MSNLSNLSNLSNSIIILDESMLGQSALYYIKKCLEVYNCKVIYNDQYSVMISFKHKLDDILEFKLGLFRNSFVAYKPNLNCKDKDKESVNESFRLLLHSDREYKRYVCLINFINSVKD